MRTGQSEFGEAGVVTADDVSLAENAKLKAQAFLVEADNVLAAARNRRERLSSMIRTNRRIKIIRKYLDSFTTRLGGLVLGLIIVCALLLVFSDIIGLRFIDTLALLIGSTALVVYFGMNLFKPSDAELEANLATWERDLEPLGVQEEEAAAIRGRAQASYDKAEGQYHRIVSDFQSRLNQLRVKEWRSLRGIEFENFLADVFREWGYQVEMTKATGDQGVDLLVAKDGVRIAVQAKGYLNSVGNDAIQQVYAGMAYYKCHKCVVITNSRFTPAAKDAAAALRCELIDGDSLPSLIDGNLSIQ